MRMMLRWTVPADRGNDMAAVCFVPVMNGDDLKKALGSM
jgi:hypothetical protein